MPSDLPAGKPYTKHVQEILRKETGLNGLMQLDFASLYILVASCLTSRLSSHRRNIPLKRRTQALNPFADLLASLESGNESLLDPYGTN
jgi:hypothetical protein